MNQCKTKDATTYMYIDNGLLNLLISKNENTEKFFKKISIKTPHNKNNCRAFPTSFSFLEFIGLTIKEIFGDCKTHADESLSDKIKNTKDNYKKITYFSEYCNNLKSLFCKRIKKNEKLTLANIEKLQEERFAKIDDPLRNSWEGGHPFFKKLDESILKNIKDDVIIDRILAHDYKSFSRQDIDSMLCGDMIRYIVKENSNFPFTRLSSKVWDHIVSTCPDPDQKILMKRIMQHTNSQYLDGKDLVDTEFIHTSAIGHFNKGKRHPVYCYTCDDYDTNRFRVFIYKFILKESCKMTKQEAEMRGNQDMINQIENYSIAEGEIVCFNQNIQIEKILDVKEVLGTFEWFEQHLFPARLKKISYLIESKQQIGQVT